MPAIHCSLSTTVCLGSASFCACGRHCLSTKKQSFNISGAQISVMLCVVFEGLLSYRGLQLVC